MANVRTGNSFYIDATTPTLDINNIRVTHITFTSTNNNGTLTLQDAVTGNPVIRVDAATSFDTQTLDFSSNPIVFPNGINPSTVTNCVVTLHIKETRS